MQAEPTLNSSLSPLRQREPCRFSDTVAGLLHREIVGGDPEIAGGFVKRIPCREHFPYRLLRVGGLQEGAVAVSLDPFIDGLGGGFQPNNVAGLF